MQKRWAGIAVSGDTVTVVELTVPTSGPPKIASDLTFKLQSGNRSAAYAVLHRQIQDYVRENKVEQVVVKASALSTGSTKMAHLHAAEVRGVVIAACASVTPVIQLQKAKLSKTFGSRKADEYVADNGFWNAEIEGSLRIGSREAALLVLASRGAA